MAAKKRTTKGTTHQEPIKRDMSDFPVFYDVSIKVSDKSFAERIQRAIQQKCGFNAELLTCAR